MKFRSTAVFIISENYRQYFNGNTVKEIQILFALICLVKEKNIIRNPPKRTMAQLKTFLHNSPQKIFLLWKEFN